MVSDAQFYLPVAFVQFFPDSEDCAQEFLSQAWAALSVVSVTNPSLLPGTMQCTFSRPSSHHVIHIGPNPWITMYHLRLGGFGFDVLSSWVNFRNRHNVRSWWDNEEGEGGANMIEDSLIVGRTKKFIKYKQREHMHTTTSQHQRSLKTLHH